MNDKDRQEYYDLYKGHTNAQRELELQFFRGIYHELEYLIQYASNNGLARNKLYKYIEENEYEEIKEILRIFYEIDKGEK
jgi:DNA-binding phage protein